MYLYSAFIGLKGEETSGGLYLPGLGVWGGADSGAFLERSGASWSICDPYACCMGGMDGFLPN